MDVTHLNTLIFTSLKSGDKIRTETLRTLLSDVRYFGIEKYRSDWEKKISASDIVEVVKKQVKKHRESIEIFSKAKRNDLTHKEQAELDVLLEFMPGEADDSVIQSAIEEAKKTGETNFGKLMGIVMKNLNGSASGERVARLLKTTL